MKKVTRIVVLVAAAWLAAACGSLPPAPSYVPSPFAGMHGQLPHVRTTATLSATWS